MDQDRGMCIYCAKWFPKQDLKPIKGDDSPHLIREYCPRCLPEVQAAHWTLPWIKNKRFY